MAQHVRRQRTATPERWQAALRRAIDGNVQVRQVGATGQWIATSASDPGTAHELTVINGVAVGCSCPAGTFGDAVCTHRAAYWHAVGMLDPADSEPAPSANAQCPTCLGSGEWRMYTGGRLSDYWVGKCRPCHGTGQVAVTLLAA